MLKILAAIALTISAASVATAQERTAVKNGFTLLPNSGKTILVFRPSVRVGAQSTGGMFEPNGDWTEQSRKHIDTALAKLQQGLGNRVVAPPEAYGEQAQRVEEYQALFAAVSQSVITYQFFVGNRLPTKKRDNKADVFDWSLGKGVADLPGAKEADYILFLYNKDAYGSTGRKLLQMVALLGPGLAIKSGEHQGYAGLVDARTGDLLWLNADGSMGGDVRTTDGRRSASGSYWKTFPAAQSLHPCQLRQNAHEAMARFAGGCSGDRVRRYSRPLFRQASASTSALYRSVSAAGRRRNWLVARSGRSGARAGGFTSGDPR